MKSQDNEFKNSLDKIDRLFKDKDWENYRILVHALKATSYTIGADHMGDKAKEMEYFVKEGNIEAVEKDHEKMMDDFMADLGVYCTVHFAGKDKGPTVIYGYSISYASQHKNNRVKLGGETYELNPQPGVEMPKEGTITINVSKGNKEGLVPSVIGMQKEDVEAYLKSYGYQLGNVNTTTSPEKEGKVLEQTPTAGSTLDKESKVDIVVSDGKGTEKGIVPSVTRMSLQDAKQAIEAAGFQVGNITYDWDSSIGKGYVIYQQYQANSQLDKGTAIDLQVSSGPEPAPEEPAEPEEGDEKKE